MASATRCALAVIVVIAAALGLTGSARADDAGAAAIDLAIDAGVAPIDAAPAIAPIDAAAPPDAAAAANGIDAGFEHAIVDGGVLDGGVIAALPDGGLAIATAPAEAAPTPAHPGKHGDRAGVVIRLVLGLTLLFVVAYLGGHRRVVKLQEQLGVSGLITAGFPFVALGVIVRQPAIGILTSDVLERLQPILHFGLGWLGFIIGAQLDIRLLDRVPKGTAYLIVVEALGPFAATAAVCAVLAQSLGISDWHSAEFWRDAIVLGAAGAMTAPRRFRGFANRGWREGRGVDHLVSQLDEIVGVIGLLFVAAYFRPSGTVGWQIPGTAWLFVSIGLGVVVGVLIFVMVREPKNEGEFAAIVLGSVALGAGLAGYLYLSPIVVCFIAGVLVVNFPCEQRAQIFEILNHLERPIHLLFLIIAGASWDVGALSPWLIVPAFAAARVAGKWMGATTAVSTVGKLLPAGFADSRVLVSPLSPLAIALVVSLQGSAGGAPSPWLVTVVVGGAVLTELAVQLTAPSTPRAPTAPSTSLLAPDNGRAAPIDELDDTDTAPGSAGPVYHDELDDDERGGR